jgi:hypothetical protein
MPRFKKKAEFVQAEQWFPDKDVAGVFMCQPPDLIIGGRGHGIQQFPQDPYPAVRNRDGVQMVKEGMWVLTFPDGSQEVEGDQSFRDAYEECGPLRLCPTRTVVTATQWWPGLEVDGVSGASPKMWCGCVMWGGPCNRPHIHPTPTSALELDPGDWILRHPDGSMSVVTDLEMKANYVTVGDV